MFAPMMIPASPTANLPRDPLTQHPSLAIVKGAGLVMRAIIGEGDAATAERMQVRGTGGGWTGGPGTEGAVIAEWIGGESG